MPPADLRILVGHTTEDTFDNPTGEPVFADVEPTAYDSVLDWGCGCGRWARRLMMQDVPPARYIGVDLHKGMVEWCQSNLTAHDPNFTFHHHDVFNAGLNPDGVGSVAPLPADDSSVGLFIAWSVFTHVTQESASFYLTELARVLRPDGVAKTTWFLFDKQDFPMMQDFQNALYINDADPTNAVIFDKKWLLDELTANGLYLRDARKPGARGFQQQLNICVAGDGDVHAELPLDDGETIRKPPPLLPRT